MKKIILSALLLMSLHGFAQTWVQVPDVNFQNYLTSHYPAAAFMTSGSDFYVDADNADIQAEDTLIVSALSISSLEGLQAFTNMGYLDCSENYLTILPSLPDSLWYLFCASNQLTSLPDLPDSLVYLFCSYNELTSLPSLPDSLMSLGCDGNQLTELPALPGNLLYLNCDHNQLLSIPLLPGNIHDLHYSYNPLTTLPDLPASLIFLACDSIQLTTLQTLPVSLIFLSCNYNLLVALPDLPPTLQGLLCYQNQLSVLPDLPITLQILECYTNQLTFLPDLPGSLQALYCGGNQITVLPELPASLTQLYCGPNQLTSLPDLPVSLTELGCPVNQLTSLPDLPNTLQKLYCVSNNISCFDEFPASIQEINIVDNPFTCLPNYIPVMTTDLLAYPLCNENDPVNNPNGCQSAMGILGTVFKDVNNDCSDTTEFLTYIPMNLNDSNGSTIISSSSLINGEYYFATAPGDYELEVNTTALSPALQVTCPVDNLLNATISVTNPVDTAGNFGLICAGFDLGVQSVVNYEAVFPGETHWLNILAGDLTAQFHAYCAAGISGEVTIDISGPGTVSFSGSPTVTGNTAVYSIADFGVAGANEFLASVLVNTNATSVDQFCVTVTVSTGTPGDLDATNDSYTYCYHVVNSYDPNIKETYPELVNVGYTDELTYTIHFQNTGNAPAMNIRLADVLDHNLDLSSLKIVNASADYTYSLDVDTRLLSIRFPNIMLADSASDPQGSIGFVQYRIKPLENLTLGTVIDNTCDIYFDYNSPITTNTSHNLYSELGLDELGTDQLKLYPNPAKNVVVLESEDEIEQMEFYSLNGTKVMIVKPGQKKAQVDISALQNGVYIVKIQSQSGIVNKRLVISQ